MTISVMTILFVVFLLVGSPVGYAMGLSAALALLVSGEAPLVLMPQLFFTSASDITLLAIPLFIFAGALMSASGITDSIISLSRVMVGHYRGGLAKANIMTNTFMAAISGSAVADAAAIGSVMIPAMKKDGYRADFAVAVTACSSMLAPILPPSIIAVVYASLTGLSVGQLFLGGILPGLLGGAGFLTLVHFMARYAGGAPLPRATARTRVKVFLSAAPAVALPVLIVGGIMSGIVTPTETAAVAVVYAMLVATLRRKLSFKRFFDDVVEAAVLSSSVLIVIGGSALFSWVLIRSGAPQILLTAILQLSNDPTVVILLVMFALFVLGTVLEPAPCLILTVPILVPIADAMHFEPISFGIAVIMMLILGAVTPPVGVLTMICAKIAGVEYSKTFRIVVPFILVWFVLATAIALFPAIATTIPSLFF